MKCDLCGADGAKFKYYEVYSDNVREINICEECARKKGVDVKNREDLQVSKNKICSTCGLTFEEYKESNHLGCVDCYKTFYEQILVYLKDSQLGLVHKGKEPVKNTKVLSVKKEILELKQKLENFVEEEKFEEAVELRDRIEERKKELKTIRGKSD